MSFHAVLWAFNQDLAPVPKLLLVALSTFANKNDGSCFPRIATIAEMASISSRTVHRRLPELADKQLVRIERKFEGKARLPHLYWLACGGDQRSKAQARSGVVTSGYDNIGKTDNHYQNHYINTQTRIPRLEQAPLARQGSRRASTAPSLESAVDQKAQVELARRLGSNGWEILIAFEAEVSQLCFQLRKGTLSEGHLSELRRRYVALTREGTSSNR